jgi:integrase
MPRIAKELKAVEVSRLTKPGLHMVGTVAGLGLSVSASGSRSWILRTMVGSRRCDIGLGGYPEVTLAKAHERARAAKDGIRSGTDPIAERRAKSATVEWTFERCAKSYIDGHAASWKNAKHAQQWRNTLASYAYPVFGSMHVRDVGKTQVLQALEPHWVTKTTTMSRVRERIELVLSWATVRGYRTGDNPAIWRGNLDQVLAKPSKVSKVVPHRALPYQSISTFIGQLAAAPGSGARCLEFVIYTACRSAEARGALWSEIDLEAGVWHIPGQRMKADRDHRIPLSTPAIKLLKSLPVIAGTDLVFPSSKNTPLSDMTLTAVLRRMKVDAVPHGFRSTFATWAQERTGYPSDVRERALAHTVGSKTTGAYERGDQFDKRIQLMADWANFVSTTNAPGQKVVPLRRGV